ncbi:MAG: ABC transporter permease, partial [Acidobacteriaceae bacterium]
MNELTQDVRYALRQIQKSLGFAFTAVLTLALAIGITTVVFSVLYATLVRPLPYNQPDRIVYLQPISPQGYTQPASYPEYLDWRRENKTFSALAGYSTGSSNFEGPAGPQPIHTVGATDNFFDVFKVAPILGRTFAIGEGEPGKNNVAVLSYEVWQQTFAKSDTVIGQTIKLDGQTYTVIGVMPAGFRYPVNQRAAIYTPLQIPKEQREQRGNHWLPTIARLKDGVSAQAAQADMDRVLADQGRAFPDSQGRRMQIQDLATQVLGDAGAPLKVLIFAVLSLLAIGCVNIAGLLLARGVKREREFALRAAVGAGRGRVVRQILTETVVLALLGAAAGIALAYGMLQVIRTLLISALSRGADVHLSTPVLLAAIAVAVITSLLAGLTPALRLSRIAPMLALKSGGSAGSGRGQHRLRAAFIITQVGLAMVLLVTSGLLMRVLAGLRSTDLGFSPDHLITEEIDLSPAAYRGRDFVTGFYQPMLEKVRAIPGVADVGLIQMLPIQSHGWNSDITIVGQPPPPKNAEMLAEDRYVTPGYFKALGIDLVRGRMLDPK